MALAEARCLAEVGQHYFVSLRQVARLVHPIAMIRIVQLLFLRQVIYSGNKMSFLRQV